MKQIGYIESKGLYKKVIILGVRTRSVGTFGRAVDYLVKDDKGAVLKVSSQEVFVSLQDKVI